MRAHADKSSATGLSLLILTCFFFSGVSGLIYEILWTRMTASVIGGAPFAVATILTVFMGGLGLGSYLASRKIDTIKQPLKLVRVYGILELLIGIYGVLLPLLLLAFKPLYAVIYNQLLGQFMAYNLVTFLACCVLLIIPVTLMGATLPILCRFYVTRLGHLGSHAGRLYGLNTIGAAAGSLLCGFWLIENLGMWGALAVAVGINAVIGLVCLVTSRRARMPKVKHDSAKAEPSETVRFGVPRYPGAVAGALIIFAVSGFCAMAYEVIWTKLLGLIVGPTTYSFAIVLVTFIVGLALGSILFGWWADRTKDAVRLLIGSQIAAALFALGASQLLGGSQMLFAKLILATQNDFALRSLLKGATLFLMMVLPTLCLGATFPLVSKIYSDSMAWVGRSIGRAYAINTIGAVLGSFSAGFILIPMMGKESSLSLVIGIQFAAALILMIIIIARDRRGRTRWVPFVVTGLIGLLLSSQYPIFNRRSLSLGMAHRIDEVSSTLNGHGWFEALTGGQEILANLQRGELLYYGDGIGGFTTVLKNQHPMGDVYYSMANSGKVDASTRGDMRTQTLLAHFPMLFHPAPKNVMVLGLASGITGGEVLNYPVDQLDVIEINRQVVRASDYFRQWNHQLLEDPRTNLIIQDGRAHLGLTEQKYDIIISEPSNPWMAGLATLFTAECFSAAKDRLNDNGMFVQFIHSYQMDWSTFALVGRTFADVFPSSLLMSTGPSGQGPDYLLVGFKGDFRPQLETAQRNLTYAQKSPNISLTDARLIYRMMLAENLDELFGNGPINTEDIPLLEFAAPKLLYNLDPSIEQNILTRGRVGDAAQEIIRQARTDIDLQIDFAAYALSVHSPFANMVDLATATDAQRERFFALADSYVAGHSINYSVLSDETLKARWRNLQAGVLEENIETLPDRAASYSYLGDLYSGLSQYEKAEAAYLKSLQYDDMSAAVHSNLGVVLTRQGKTGQAVKRFERSLNLDPGFGDACSGMGLALAIQGYADEATKYFERALALNQNDVGAHYNLGLTLARGGNVDGAIEHFSAAVRLNPRMADAHCNLGISLSKKGRYDEAITHLNEALRLRPDFPEAQRGLEQAQFQKELHNR